MSDLDQHIEILDGLCEDECIKETKDHMDQLQLHLHDIAKSIGEIELSLDDGYNSIAKETTCDFSSRIFEISDDLRSLIGKIEDADIPGMARDIKLNLKEIPHHEE